MRENSASPAAIPPGNDGNLQPGADRAGGEPEAGGQRENDSP